MATRTDENIIRVLHVDDEPDFAELTATFLEREDDRFSVETAANVQDGLSRLAETEFDCIVSDYEMPGQDGLEYLEIVREDYPDLPFILFTGKGSEEVASEAISAGVTDYLQKKGGTEQYTVLANRINNAVERTRAQRARQRHLDTIETAQEGIAILDEEGYFIYVNEAYTELYGYDRNEMLGEHWELIYPDEEVTRIREQILPVVDETGHWSGTTTGLRADGNTFREDHVLAQTVEGELVCTVQDITNRENLQQKYELVAQASTDAFWDWNPQTDEISRSKEYLSGFGYAPSDVKANTDWWRERIHPEDRDRVLQTLNQAVENPEDTYDETYRFRRKDGTYGYVRSRGYVVYDDDGDPTRMVGAHIDITDRKERERELQLYKTLVESMEESAILVDTNKEYIFANDVVPGPSSEEEWIGQPVSVLSTVEGIDDDDIIEHQEAIQEILSGKEERVSHTLEFAASDEETRILEVRLSAARDSTGELIGVSGILRDITTRKEREQAIEDLHSTARTLMEGETDEEIAEYAVEAGRNILDLPLCSVHLWDQQIEGLVPVSWTDCVTELIGELPTFYPGQSLAWETFDIGEKQIFNDISTAANCLNPETVVRSELILPLSDHGVFIISSPEPDAFDDVDVSLAEILAAHTEVALDRIEREQELKRQNDRLEEFASIVSHDLRSPLQVADGRLELARAECESDHLDEARNALDRMDRMIENVLTLAHEGEGAREIKTVDLTETIEACWRTIKTAEATLIVEIDQTVNADPGQLKHLFENLLKNAVDHGGDTVTVTVGKLEDKAGFYIADDGPGIPEDERETVFESGYSTAGKGTGLGLAIVKKIVEAHNWAIRVTDSADGGARFEITEVEWVTE